MTTPRVNGPQAAPLTTNGQVLVGKTGAVPQVVTMSGDVTINNLGATSIATSAVTSTKILDGEIVNADIHASAAIAVTKLAAGSAGHVLSMSGVTPTWMNPLTTNFDLYDTTVSGTTRTTTWTVPAGVTRVWVEVWGGGGGGGGSNGTNYCQTGAGGGGGGYAKALLTVTPADVWTVVVGAGGTAGVSDASLAGNGVDSSVSRAGVSVTGSKGMAGGPGAAGPGSGGSGSGVGVTAIGFSGSAGGLARASSASAHAGGTEGGKAGGNGGWNQAVPGGGGPGGGTQASCTGANGGAGADGRVIFWY